MLLKDDRFAALQSFPQCLSNTPKNRFMFSILSEICVKIQLKVCFCQTCWNSACSVVRRDSFKSCTDLQKTLLIRSGELLAHGPCVFDSECFGGVKCGKQQHHHQELVYTLGKVSTTESGGPKVFTGKPQYEIGSWNWTLPISWTLLQNNSPLVIPEQLRNVLATTEHIIFRYQSH